MLLLGSRHLNCEAGHGRGHVLAIDGTNPPEVVGNGVVNGLMAVQLALLHIGLLVDVGPLHTGESQYNVS